MTFLLDTLRKKRGLRRYIGPKRILLLAVLVAVVLVAWDAYSTGTLSPALVERYRDEHPVLAVVLFVVVYALSVTTALPSLPLNLAAGFFWGGLAGGLYTTVGVTLGGWVSFAMARWFVGQPLAERFDAAWAQRVQTEFERSGWRFVAFARINPIIPTGPLNYLLGLTSLSNRDFLWVSFVFLLPPSIAVAYVGDTLQTFAANQSDVREIIRAILGASAALTLVVALKYVFRIFGRKGEAR